MSVWQSYSRSNIASVIASKNNFQSAIAALCHQLFPNMRFMCRILAACCVFPVQPAMQRLVSLPVLAVQPIPGASNILKLSMSKLSSDSWDGLLGSPTSSGFSSSNSRTVYAKPRTRGTCLLCLQLQSMIHLVIVSFLVIPIPSCCYTISYWVVLSYLSYSRNKWLSQSDPLPVADDTRPAPLAPCKPAYLLAHAF